MAAICTCRGETNRVPQCSQYLAWRLPDDRQRAQVLRPMARHSNVTDRHKSRRLFTPCNARSQIVIGTHRHSSMTNTFRSVMSCLPLPVALVCIRRDTTSERVFSPDASRISAHPPVGLVSARRSLRSPPGGCPAQPCESTTSIHRAVVVDGPRSLRISAWCDPQQPRHSSTQE